MERESQDLETHPVVVRFNCFVVPAYPNEDSKQADFLGAHIDNPDDVEANQTRQNTPGGSARSRNDMYSVRNAGDVSSASIPSINTVIEVDVVMHLSHERLCTFIDTHRSMQGAEIVRSCTFVEKKRVAPHRCILLELHRPGRKKIWVRLERKPTSRAALVSGKGKTPSNDVVSSTISSTVPRCLISSLFQVHSRYRGRCSHKSRAV